MTTQPAAGNPLLKSAAPGGAFGLDMKYALTPGLTLTTTVESGSVIAKVTVPADAPTGTSYLVFTDGAGKQKEQVTLNVQAKPAPKQEEPKPADDKKEPPKKPTAAAKKSNVQSGTVTK